MRREQLIAELSKIVKGAEKSTDPEVTAAAGVLHILLGSLHILQSGGMFNYLVPYLKVMGAYSEEMVEKLKVVH